MLNRTWQDLGVEVSKECAGGHKAGICWVPSSQHPVTARRSHSGIGHYSDVVSSRPNYELLVRHQVIRVVYPRGPGSSPPLIEVRSLENHERFNVTVKGEVILSAGALHTPYVGILVSLSLSLMAPYLLLFSGWSAWDCRFQLLKQTQSAETDRSEPHRTILQRSGIGPASFSKTMGIPIVLDLPGVGSNLQDHSGPPVSWNCKTS